MISRSGPIPAGCLGSYRSPMSCTPTHPSAHLAAPQGQPQAVQDTQAAAARARQVVMEIERPLGFEPVDREFEKLGCDIESRVPGSGRLRFIEVKGRASGAETITVTRNETLYSLNKPDDFILAIVEFLDDGSHRPHYLRQPFQRDPDFGAARVNHSFAELLTRADHPLASETRAGEPRHG